MPASPPSTLSPCSADSGQCFRSLCLYISYLFHACSFARFIAGSEERERERARAAFRRRRCARAKCTKSKSTEITYFQLKYHAYASCLKTMCTRMYFVSFLLFFLLLLLASAVVGIHVDTVAIAERNRSAVCRMPIVHKVY